jgi:hypothetical protein
LERRLTEVGSACSISTAAAKRKPHPRIIDARKIFQQDGIGSLASLFDVTLLSRW